MELDTGSAVSVISRQDYEEKFKHLPLEHTSILLRTYTGGRVAPDGVIRVDVDYEEQRCQDLRLFVVKRGGPPLFGRDWLQTIRLDWKSISSISLSATNLHGKVKDIQMKHSDIFKEEMGTMKSIKARLVVEDECQPRFLKARPVPYALRKKVEEDLERLVAAGVLLSVETSEWATPIVPVVKPNGTVCICGDFKVTVNPVLSAQQYPMPRAEDMFATLAGGKHFSKIDLSSAYLQMEVEEDSKKYLTINTHKGLFTYQRLPFGITSSPAIFQRAMEQILQGLDGVLCYQDDILITGENDDVHLQNLDKVLQRVEEYGLRVNQGKCEFFKKSLKFLGHVIDSTGLHTSPDKVKAIIDAPCPTNVAQLRSFLGLINYYGRFLPNLSTVLHPLNQLLQKDWKWSWTPTCNIAFTEAKKLIASNRVLTHFDSNLPIKLACDASSYGIGAVISHTMSDGSEKPIAFASRTLNKSERNYAQIEKEALSLVYGVKKFHQYLYGQKFTLVTDHQPLTSIFGPKKGIPTLAAARMQRWAIFLSGHTYDIEYKSTLKHSNADGLSRSNR